jgi:predicted CDP-diglyceride synthetase/phosphatidate cytidylyltransferase
MSVGKSVVSGCRKVNLLVCLVVVGVIALYALHEDLTSDGLRRTQVFLAIGYAIYPLFYGACAFCILKLASLYRRADAFVSLNSSSLFVWDKEIPLREVSSISVKRGLFLRWLIIAQNNGTETKVSSAALIKPVDNVAQTLKAAAGVS